jgi:oligopeptidase B (EC:3.4.21.83). Serine peptidase. MEROPS family S09A
LVNAKPRLIVRDRASGTEHEVAFLESAYELAAIPGYEFNSANLRFDYSSPSTPNQVWDYDMAARSRLLRKTREIPSGHDPNEYIVERIEAIAEDGAQVPVTILRRTDMMLDGTAPALLGGYGSYGATIPTGFRSNWLSLADRGWVVAWAHIRGGKDKGYDWYLDGKRDKKQNTFKDFVAAGEALVAKKYVQRGRIVAQGGSAGGLLVGAAVNRAPELFAGVIAAVPFVDVINTMSDASLPLTPPEWPEWG